MISTSFLHRRFDLSGFLTTWDSARREDLVPSIIVASVSALLFSCLGLLWMVANVHLDPAWSQLPIILLVAILTAGYCTVRFRPMIATVLGFVLALKLGVLFGAANGYFVYSAGAGFPLIDEPLYAIDQWLGFDWQTMLRWFGDHPNLAKLTGVAYDQAGTQLILALPLLVLMRQNVRLMTLVSAQFLALVTVHIVAIFAPAVGVYGYLGLTPADHPGLVLTSEGHTAVHVMQLRTGELFDLTRVPMMGLITFPSFHTVMAIQSAWVFWQIRLLRWPAVAFNIAVWVGTLLHGSHHLSDTIAGAAVAVVTIYAAYWLIGRVRAGIYGDAVSAH
jgi:hypothetical protein